MKEFTEEEQELIRNIVSPYYSAAKDMPYGSPLREGFEENVEDFGKTLKQLVRDASACKLFNVITSIPRVMNEKDAINQALAPKTQHEIEQRIDKPMTELFKLIGKNLEHCKRAI